MTAAVMMSGPMAASRSGLRKAWLPGFRGVVGRQLARFLLPRGALRVEGVDRDRIAHGEQEIRERRIHLVGAAEREALERKPLERRRERAYDPDTHGTRSLRDDFDRPQDAN